MNTRLKKLEQLNRKIKSPQELSDVFLPRNHKKQFIFMFVAEMPSMNKPKYKNRDFNFDITARDKFFQEMLIKYGVGGSYVTDIVKGRDTARKPTKTEIQKWLPFLIEEINIIQPRTIIVLGKRTYESSFRPFIEPLIPKNIKIDYVFHYCSQVPRVKFEKKFSEVINKRKDKNKN